jgi:hypothetical protein
LQALVEVAGVGLGALSLLMMPWLTAVSMVWSISLWAGLKEAEALCAT